MESPKEFIPHIKEEKEYEDIEKELIRGYFEFLIMRSKKINEGNNGIIKILEATEMPEEIVSYLTRIFLMKEINSH